MSITSRFNQSTHITHYMLVILFLISFVPRVAQADAVIHPFAPTFQLADAATCATGPNIDLFINTVLMTAASSGWSFRGYCGVVEDRPQALVVLFRDIDGLKYLAWYDSEFDSKQRSAYSGGFEVKGIKLEIANSLGTGGAPVWAKSTTEVTNLMNTLVMNLGDTGYGMAARLNSNIEKQQGGCRPGEPNYFCAGGQSLDFGPEKYRARLESVGDIEGNGLSVSIYRERDRDSLFANLIIAASITYLSYGLATEIGLAFAFSEAATAATAGGLAGFGTALATGQNLEDSFLNGLAGAAIAYVAQVGLDRFGDPFALVGAEGKPCPTGDQCWALQLAAKLPPIQRLAEFHDPFIVWSETALGTIGTQAWYLAVTIPPFVVPGCAANSACVTTGLLLVDEKELL